MTSRFLWLSLVLCLLACEQAHRNPCGPGLRPSAAEDRCVEISDAASGPISASDDAGSTTRPRSKDAGSSAEDSGKGEHDAGHKDAGIKAQDSGTPDSGMGPDIPPQSCLEPDIAAWETFHLSNQLVSTIGSCSKSLGCTPGAPCALDECLRKAAGVSGCSACASAEVTCVANNCQKPCAASDQECRACACAAGCLGQFEACAERTMSVCTMCDVNPGQCGGDTLAPELIMIVVSPLLY